MKTILKILAILFLSFILLVLYFNYTRQGSLNINVKEIVRDYFPQEKLVGPFVSGLEIIEIEKDSPLNKIGLATLAGAENYGESSLKSGDVITGVVTDYKKSNFWDILTRQQKSEYFIPINTEQELYNYLQNINETKIMLGVVRKEFKGITREEAGLYRYRPDIAVFYVDKLEGNYLKVKLETNKIK